MDSEIKSALMAAGFSARLITAAVVIGGAFFIYRTYLEATLIRLEIKKLKGDLGSGTNTTSNFLPGSVTG